MTGPDTTAWAQLVERAQTAAAKPERPQGLLCAAVKAVAGRVIPTRAHADQAAFVALQGVARAFAEGDEGRRSRLAPCLVITAAECARPLPGGIADASLSWLDRADIGG